MYYMWFMLLAINKLLHTGPIYCSCSSKQQCFCNLQYELVWDLSLCQRTCAVSICDRIHSCFSSQPSEHWFNEVFHFVFHQRKTPPQFTRFCIRQTTWEIPSVLQYFIKFFLLFINKPKTFLFHNVSQAFIIFVAGWNESLAVSFQGLIKALGASIHFPHWTSDHSNWLDISAFS